MQGREDPRPYKPNMKKNQFILILSTIHSQKAAEKIATTLVREKLAACVNITSKIRSVYPWKGKLCRDDEVLMILKTRKSLYKKLEKRIRSLHPYEVPEIIALPIARGSRDYLKWLDESTS